MQEPTMPTHRLAQSSDVFTCLEDRNAVRRQEGFRVSTIAYRRSSEKLAPEAAYRLTSRANYRSP